MALGMKAVVSADSKEFTEAMDKIKSSSTNVKKELRQMERDIVKMELAYRNMSKEEQKSEFGEHLRNEILKATAAAAEFKDVSGDISGNIAKMASDSVLFDGLSEAIGMTSSALSAFASSLGIAKNDGSLAANAINLLTKAQTYSAAAIKIVNALQKESKILSAVRLIQLKAEKAAQDAATAATGRATIAQKLFNTVAKANPYVLLATAIVGVVGAIGAFIAINNKHKQSEEQAAKSLEIHKNALDAYKSSLTNSLSSSILSYKTLQEGWKNCRTELEKTKFIKEHKTEIDKLGQGVKNTADAERVFEKNTKAVVAGLIKRAKAAAKAAQAQVYYQEAISASIELEEIQAKKNKELSEVKGDKKVVQNIGTTSTGAVIQNSYIETAAQQREKIVKKYEAEEKERQSRIKELNAKGDKLIQEAVKGGYGTVENVISNKSGGKNTTDEIKAAVGSIADLEAQISKLQELAKKGALPEDLKDPSKFKAKIEDLQKQAKELKIQWGFEEPEKAKTKLEQLEEALKKAKLTYDLAIEVNDETARQAALDAYRVAEKELNDHKLALTIEPEISNEERAAIKKAVSDIVNDALAPDTSQKFDFSALKSKLPEELAEQVDKTLEQYSRISEARDKLQEQMNTATNDAEIAAAQEGLEQLHEAWVQLTEDVNLYNEANQEVEKQQKSMENLSKTVSSVGNAVSAAGDLFSALGESAEDNDMKAMGIIAKAIATIALSFAQALTTCKTWVDWLAFGITGLATMATMITQVKNLSAGSYASGGIIPGNSYTGDRMIARVNSGEMILNGQQQKNLFDAIDQNRLGGGGISLESVKVRGADIYLSQKNYKKINHLK